MTKVVLDWIYNEHGHHLTNFNQPFFSRASLRTYATWKSSAVVASVAQLKATAHFSKPQVFLF